MYLNLKILFFNLLLLSIVISAFGQNHTRVSGKVLDSKTKKPMQSVIVSIQNTNQTQITDQNGIFSFEKVVSGKQLILLKTNGYKEQLFQIEINEFDSIDLGLIFIEEDISTEKQINLITILDNDLGDDNNGSEGTAGLLQASKDVFQQATAYNFGNSRFKVRGIDNEYSSILFNGVLMNKTSDGRPQYSNWGGLNDVTRNQEFIDGSKPSDYTFGGLGGVQYITTQASTYRPGTRISFLGSNTNYNYRTMVTHSSGMRSKGWAYTLSGSRRWAQEAHFEGTDYAANSFFISLEKKINENHSFNLTAIYAQNRRGKNSPNTNEISDLKGIKYNSYWGYQEGEKRNSRTKEINEPLFILSHYWNLNPKSKLQTNVLYQFGKIGSSRIDFQRATNPDPAYYNKLPSFHTTFYNYDSNEIAVYTPNLEYAERSKSDFLTNAQLDWKEMYKINKENSPKGSRYILYEDRNDHKTLISNITFSTLMTDHIIMNAGVSYTKSQSFNFKNLIDLLGGDFFNDVNLFGSTYEQQQPDLNNTDRKIKTGEKFGYNFHINSAKFDVFTQFKFTFEKIDFYLGQSFIRNSYQREGLYRNGYYPNFSFGKSEKIRFDNFGFKGGLTYKITGHHYLDLNGVYMSKAPTSNDVFPNSRLSNQVTNNIANETLGSFDFSYIIKMPNFRSRLTTYLNQTVNTTEVSFYYADNISSGNGEYVSEVITGQKKRNRGVELGIEYQINSTIKLIGVGAYGDYDLINNPNLNINSDRLLEPIYNGTVEMQGYKQAGMPEQAYSFGVEYRDPKYWWIGTNINYIANIFLDIAPLIRTSKYLSDSDEKNFPFNPTLSARYLKQEKFSDYKIINLVGGKSWLINNKRLGLFATVNNLLDLKYKTGGFEQSRNGSYSELYKDHSGPTRSFGPKYFYGYGRTYMVNVYINF